MHTTSPSTGPSSVCDNYKATATCNNWTWTNSNVWDTQTYRYLSCTNRNCALNWVTVNHNSSATFYNSTSVPYNATCQSQVRVCTNGVLGGNSTYQYSWCVVQTPLNCTLDWVNVNHNSSAIFYKSPSVAYNATCQSLSRKCINGTFDWDSTYQYSWCVVQTPLNCTLNGQTILHWNSITRYESASVPYGQTCQSQVRTCTNGVLSWSYQNISCVVEQPLNCTLNGQTILHWNSITRYESASVPYGQTCQSQVRTCTNGILSWSYQNASCVVEQPFNCTLDWVNVNHNSSVTFYNSASVPYNATCQSQVRTCTNGLLDGSSSYQYSWCVVNPPVWCTTLWWSGIAHWQGVTWYKKQTPTNMTTNDCDINDNARYYTCSIGQWKYNGSIVNIDGYPHSSYKYSNCWYRTCSLVGQTFDHWVTTTAYKFTTPSSNGSYNICENNQATATCQNGTWSNYNVGVNQTYKYPTCTNRTCSFVGQEFPSSVTITAYRYQNPPYQWANYSCSNSNNYTSVTCQNGNWSSSTFQYTYPYLTCTGRTCALNGQTFQDWDTVIAYKFTTPSSNGSNYACENNQRTAICQNGNWSDSTVGDGKTYRYITCTNRTCKLPESSEMVEHWTVATRYRYANSTSYRPCNQYMQTATCQNGTRNPSFSSTYKYLTCS